MCRPWMSPLACVVFMLLIAAPPLPAQSPNLDREIVGADLDIKEFAKARFEAEQARLADLAKKRRDAIAVCFQIRYQQYLAGAAEPGTGTPVTLNVLLEAGVELAEAELALSDKPSDRLALRAQRWLMSWQVERIVAVLFRLGRVSSTSFEQGRSIRLADEIKVLEVLPDKNRAEPFLTLPSYFESGTGFGGDDLKDLARAQFEAAQAKPRELAKARRDALRASFLERFDLYRRGANEPGTGQPITLPRLLALWEELTEAELALSDTPAARLAAQATLWRLASEVEHITEAQFRFGRVHLVALMQARSARLTEEIKLRDMLAGGNREEPFMLAPEFLDGEENNPERVKSQAQAQFEASQAKPHDLALARRDALETDLRFLEALFRAGAIDPGMGVPIPPHLLHKAEMQFLEAELALSDKPADRLAVYEKDWAWSYLVEEITRRQYQRGRISAADYARARFDRLGAEMRLLEAQGRK